MPDPLPGCGSLELRTYAANIPDDQVAALLREFRDFWPPENALGHFVTVLSLRDRIAARPGMLAAFQATRTDWDSPHMQNDGWTGDFVNLLRQRAATYMMAHCGAAVSA